MKKLKIFLLLSILLCFGFALIPEVHAQGNGPKAFEVDEVLPATTQLRISWDNNIDSYFSHDEYYYIKNNLDDKLISIFNEDFYINNIPIYLNDSWIDPYESQSYIDLDTTSWSLDKRTIKFIEYTRWEDPFSWEDLAPTEPSNAKPFEVGDELPAGYIKISWDFTGYPMAIDGDFLISSDGDFSIRIWEFDNITLFINDEQFYADTPGYTIITLTESVTITDMDGYDDYYEYIHGALFWEVVSQDYLDGFIEARELYGFDMGGYWISGEQAWNNGYDLGSELAWEEGFEYGMERYAYYDPITEQWLSVEEYLELYSAENTGQNDFYANFDKYFIPAMIIVFGGAIVLTILKVFKGRE